jgi:hypothetical protein
VAKRDKQEVGRDEGRILGAGEPDRRVEHGRVEGATREWNEDPAGAGTLPAEVEAAARDERRSEHCGQTGEGDDRGDHSLGRSLSARLATTRMSRPGNSRTMRERSEPPKISRRRDSSGVPTKMYVEPRLGGDASHRSDEVVSLFLEEVHAEDACEPAQGGELRGLLLGRRPARRLHPDRVHLRAEPLGRAPRTPHDPLRFRLRPGRRSPRQSRARSPNRGSLRALG